MTSFSRSFVSLLFMSLVASSCGDPSSAAFDPAGPALEAGRAKPAGTLLVCAPTSYDSVTKVIGPAGGVIVAGGHVLIVDSMALLTPVSITAIAPPHFLNLVRFRPEGLKFRIGVNGFGAIAATSVDDCGVHPNQVLRVVNITDALAIKEYMAPVSTTDSLVVVTKYKSVLGDLWVGGLLRHFSDYAVAY
jgi:hypothetical protein